LARILLIAGQAESLVNFRGDLIAAMQAAGHEVHAAAGACTDDLLEKLATLGVVLHPTAIARTGMNPLSDARTCLAFYRLMRRIKPEIVLAYTIKPVIYGMLAAQLAGIHRRFALITGLGFAFTNSGGGAKRGLLRGVLTLLYKLALRNAGGVIFQNPDDQKFFIDAAIVSPRMPTHRVHGSGVNTERFEKAPLPEAPIFLMIGRLLADKGVREYAAAARLLKAHIPAARCQLLGAMDSNPSAITKAELEGWVKDGAIEYLGVLADVRPAHAAASVFVLPSYREGTSRAALEAMAMGRAIISTDAPGCRETVVAGKNGVLVPVRDAQALADAMMELAAETAKRETMGAASRALAESLYDVRKVNAQMLSIMGLVA
jgi:glycosyltransferase involved in cell wall biosynthesis